MQQFYLVNKTLKKASYHWSKSIPNIKRNLPDYHKLNT